MVKGSDGKEKEFITSVKCKDVTEVTDWISYYLSMYPGKRLYIICISENKRVDIYKDPER